MDYGRNKEEEILLHQKIDSIFWFVKI